MGKILTLAFVLGLSHMALASRPVRGTYEVPVDGDLAAFSSFDVKFKSEEYSRQPVSVTFPLPLELTGIQNSISMRKSDRDPSVWSGPQVNATCKKVDRYFICHMRFNDLNADPLKAEEVINQRNPDPVSAESIVNVMKKFSGEGIGILTYKLRGGERE